MTLAEQYVLYALDPMRGRPAAGVDGAALRRGTAAAILAELVLHHRLRGDAARGVVVDALPDYNPLLVEASALLHRDAGPVPITEAIERIARGIPRLERRVIDSLVARDLLHHYRQAFLWHRYPLRSRQALDEVVAMLDAVIDGESTGLRELAFASLVDATAVASVRLTDEQRKRLRARLAADDPGARVDGESFRLIRAIARSAGADAD